MTHEQTTPASVDVTQADRDRAEAFWQEYGPFRMGTVSALSAAFARHRMAHSAHAGEVEPVAWLVRHEMHGTEVTTLKCTEADKAYGWTETPLYTHPAPPADLVELVEAAWRAGFQTARDCLPDDADDVLTEDVEHDQWLDSNTRTALAKHGVA